MTGVFLQLFGSMRLLIEGEEVALPGRNERWLLAIFALYPGRSWSRERLAELLWPDVDFSVSGNRLRTSLVYFRRWAKESLILQTIEHEVFFDSDQWQTDLQTAQQLKRSADLADDQNEARTALEQLAQLIAPGLLPDSRESWLVPHQNEWQGAWLDVLLKRADLEFSVENHEPAAQLAKQVLLFRPASEQAWGLFLRASGKIAQGIEAFQFLKDVRRMLPEEISPDVYRLGKLVRDGALEPTADQISLPVGVEPFLGQLFREMIVRDPAAAAEVLLHPAIRDLVPREAPLILILAEECAQRLDATDSVRIRLKVLQLRCMYMISDAKNGLELAERLIKLPHSPLDRRRVLTYGAYLFNSVGNRERALAWIGDAIGMTSETEEPKYYYPMVLERAMILATDDQVDLALECCIDCLQKARIALPDDNPFIPGGVEMKIGGMLVDKGQSQEALAWLESAYRAASLGHVILNRTLAEAAWGCALICEGQTTLGAKKLISALIVSLNSRSSVNLIGISRWVLQALIHQKDFPTARRVLDWIRAYRSQEGKSATPYDVRIESQLEAEMKDEEPGAIPHSAKAMTLILIERLEEIAAVSSRGPTKNAAK